jgi:hypothetical protein
MAIAVIELEQARRRMPIDGWRLNMFIELSNDQRQAVEAQGTPLKILDPRTGHIYMLVDENLFQQLQALFGDDLANTYQAQIESAMRAGWDDPLMDEYNDYDRHHKP